MSAIVDIIGRGRWRVTQAEANRIEEILRECSGEHPVDVKCLEKRVERLEGQMIQVQAVQRGDRPR